MAGEWTPTTLGDCVRFVSGGTPSKSNTAFWGGSTPWISAKDMKTFWVNSSEDMLTEVGTAAATSLVSAGSTLLLVRGMTLHNEIPIVRVGQPSAFNQDVKAVLPREGVVPEYIPYLLLGKKAELRAKVDAAGHGTGRLALDTLLSIKVQLPNRSVQAAIADLLGSLDDKIELNRRMAATLEEIARALFTSWFVDFDPVRAKAEGRDTGVSAETSALFPKGFKDEGVPKGWDVGSVASILDINPSTPLRSGTRAPYVDMAALPTSGPSVAGYILRDASSGSRFRQGDTLVARITPCLENGKTALVDFLSEDQVGWGSTEFIILRPKAPMSAAWPYLLARNESFRAHLTGSMTGSSGRQRVPHSAVSAWEMALPPPGILEAFSGVVDPLFDRIRAIAAQSQTLRDLRDTLLPKLISGELRIKNAEKAVAA